MPDVVLGVLMQNLQPKNKFRKIKEANCAKFHFKKLPLPAKFEL